MPRDGHYDEFLEQLLKRVSPEVARSFTAPQLAELRRTLSPRRHPVDIRGSIPVLGRRYYLVLFAGRERRSPERMRADRRQHPLLTLVNGLVLGAFGLMCLLAAAGGLSLVLGTA